MFCKYCGTELKENAKFCTQCGTGLDKPEPAKEPVAVKPKANKRIIAVAVAALAAVAALVVFLCVKDNSVNASPEKVVTAFLISGYELDVETQVKCCLDSKIKEIAEEYDLPKIASRRAVAKAAADEIAHETPKKVKIKSVRIVNEDVDIQEYNNIHFDLSDRERKNMQKVAEVKVRYTVDGEEDTMEIFTVKIKNKWYILPVVYADAAPVE